MERGQDPRRAPAAAAAGRHLDPVLDDMLRRVGSAAASRGRAAGARIVLAHGGSSAWRSLRTEERTEEGVKEVKLTVGPACKCMRKRDEEGSLDCGGTDGWVLPFLTVMANRR